MLKSIVDNITFLNAESTEDTEKAEEIYSESSVSSDSSALIFYAFCRLIGREEIL